MVNGKGFIIINLPYLVGYAEFLYRMKYTSREDVLGQMEEGIVFTDDYAPTDAMYAGF